MRARDVDQADRALRGWRLPCWNFVFADTEHADDIGVVEFGSRLCFTFKTLDIALILGEVLAEHFECDKPVEALFVGFVNDTHAAAPQFGND